MRYLIKEGIIVSSQGQEKGDILIQDEKILQVGQGLSPGDEETEEAFSEAVPEEAESQAPAEPPAEAPAVDEAFPEGE